MYLQDALIMHHDVTFKASDWRLSPTVLSNQGFNLKGLRFLNRIAISFLVLVIQIVFVLIPNFVIKISIFCFTYIVNYHFKL